MNETVQLYQILAYTDSELWEVEAPCLHDEHAKGKARRYGSLRYFKGLPAMIYSHVVCLEKDGARIVGTWEYQLKGDGKPGYIWHEGGWSARPSPPSVWA